MNPFPKNLLWDYKTPPNDQAWQLQRLADFFPSYGTDFKTVENLFEHRFELKLEPGKEKLIEFYKNAWDQKNAKHHE